MKAIEYLEQLKTQFPNLADLAKEENKDAYFEFLQSFHKDFVTVVEQRVSKKDSSISITGIVAIIDEMNKKGNVLAYLMEKQANKKIISFDWFLILIEETAKTAKDYYMQYKENPQLFFAVNRNSRMVINFHK